MAPSNLQGLNIVHPEPPTHPYVSDADLLAQLPPFADFNAQLDLWTDLSFQSDEPIVPKDDKKGAEDGKYGGDDSDKYEDEDADTSIDEKQEATSPNDSASAAALPGGVPLPDVAQQPSNLDVAQILAGFGIGAFGAPPQLTSAPPASSVPSLAQLLNLYSTQSAAAFPPQPYVTPASVPVSDDQSVPEQPQASEPTAKRSRTRKSSTATVSSDNFESPAQQDGAPLSAAEDKRRRNTAASARFRLKKKEREQALEKKAKELEIRVTELERECEGLRRENGWLKGLVVGVTGAQQHNKQKTQTSTAITAGSKRSREEWEDVSP
ncbi:hypothetical protein NEOLEDRAFT_1128750 [Neolentinus lepideus HHB14362 ss-1]|uniref:BZIP domain-containing protein n=1 Tax=Neolentinus lepideus HHB14362 ss-1 TaxID=1314782 RepID=A0A165V507_9AGAM|nr:hypothetical protein NEOLEDRAFT_1128750 [Neolentinus lepideus HHB14362 ss-1]